MDLGAILAERKSGAERLHDGEVPLGSTLRDYWSWSASNLADNTQRGVLAEFIVGVAIGADLETARVNWGGYDLVAPGGIRVEVKSAAYLQAWAQKRPSSIQFVVPKRKSWDGDTGTSAAEAARLADVYVFALLAHRDKATLDPLDVSQWEFYVVPTKVLDRRARSQHSITLASLKRITEAARFEALRDEVNRAAAS